MTTYLRAQKCSGQSKISLATMLSVTIQRRCHYTTVIALRFIEEQEPAGYEVHEADGRYVGQVEAAWPMQQVCLVVDVDTGRDDALLRSEWRIARLADGEALRRWLTDPDPPDASVTP